MYIDLSKLQGRINIAAALEQYLQSNVPKDIRVSEHLSEVFYPLPSLPVVAQDVTTKDGIVMVKGTLVGLVGQIEANSSPSFRFAIPSDSGGTDTGIGVIPIAEDYVNGGTLTVSAFNSHWGYADDHIAVIVPANGGNAVSYSYTTYDVTLGTYLYTGTLATTRDTITIPANKPIGVTMTHIMQDARGRKLNYYNRDNRPFGLYTDGYLDITFINWPKFATALSDTGTFSASAGYDAIKSLFPFCYVDDSGTSVSNGMWVNSDTYGRFVVDTGSTFGIQTVGKFIAADFKMPKQLDAYIDNHLGSTLRGTMTGGIEENVFVIASLIGTAMTGSTPTISTVVNWVKTGCIGRARILLMLD